MTKKIYYKRESWHKMWVRISLAGPRRCEPHSSKAFFFAAKLHVFLHVLTVCSQLGLESVCWSQRT